MGEGAGTASRSEQLREARAAEEPRRTRALDAYARARETVALAPRLSLDPGATMFELGGILASVALKR